MRRPREPAAASSAPPFPHFWVRSLHAAAAAAGLVRVFCLGAFASAPAAGATSLDAAQASPVLVSFFSLTLARRTSAPNPVPHCDFPPRSFRGGEGGKLSPQPQRTAGHGGCDF